MIRIAGFSGRCNYIDEIKVARLDFFFWGGGGDTSQV